MSDTVETENVYQPDQQDIDGERVEIVDSGRVEVIDVIDQSLLEMDDAVEETIETHEYSSELKHEISSHDSPLHMNVSEEVVVETEETHCDVHAHDEMEEEISAIENGSEDEEDITADREVDETIRDPISGDINLTMDLEDLVSRTITFDNGERIILCFSKRCRPQIAWNGHLYMATSDLSDVTYTRWHCVNDGCAGALRTSPGLTELRSSGQQHLPSCKSNDIKIRLRIVVYDLRLMAEFTDDPLKDLYSHFTDKLAVENPDVLALFPPLESLLKTLSNHRQFKIYRRRFEFERLMTERRRGVQPRSKISVPEFTPPTRRSRPFPPSVCLECGVSLVTDTDTTSQENFVEHLTSEHNRLVTIQYYSFPGVHLFEQWMRELQLRTRYKIRRFALHNESLFFLCALDDRWCRTFGANSDGCHCSAFVRVYDYRRVSRLETRVLRIQYCLDHCFHSDNDTTVDEPYTPEVFMHEIDERRQQHLDALKNRQGAPRRQSEIDRIELGGGNDEPLDWSQQQARDGDSEFQVHATYDTNYGTRSATKRRLDYENTPDQAAPEFEDEVDTDRRENVRSQTSAKDDYQEEVFETGVEEIDAHNRAEDGQPALKKSVSDQRQAKIRFETRGPRFMLEKSAKHEFEEKRQVAEMVERFNHRALVDSRHMSSGTQPFYLTRRDNFSNYTLFNLVMQIELQSELLKERAQNLKQVPAARKYLKYLNTLCEMIINDPECTRSDETLAQEMFGVKKFANDLFSATVTADDRGVGLSAVSFAAKTSETESSNPKPLIFVPIVPIASTSPAKDVDRDADFAELNSTNPEQSGPRRSKRYDSEKELDEDAEEKDEDVVDDSEFVDNSLDGRRSKGRKESVGFGTKFQPVREPYLTRRSRGVFKPNTTGAFDPNTYVANVPEVGETKTAGGSNARTTTVVFKRIPVSSSTVAPKVKLGGQAMQIDAVTKSKLGKPFTLKTMAGSIVTVMRNPEGNLVMVSKNAPKEQQISTQKVVRATEDEEPPKSPKPSKQKAQPRSDGKKIMKSEEAVDKEAKAGKVPKPEKRSVFSKLIKKDKERRDERHVVHTGGMLTRRAAEKLQSALEKEKERERESDNEDEVAQETEQKPSEVEANTLGAGVDTKAKQLSEHDMILMDDENFDQVATKCTNRGEAIVEKQCESSTSSAQSTSPTKKTKKKRT